MAHSSIGRISGFQPEEKSSSLLWATIFLHKPVYLFHMKVVISGSRTLTNKRLVESYLETCEFNITTLICGYDPEKKLPKGVDEIAYNWAKSKGIATETYPADWDKFGKTAGILRNKQMVQLADALVAIWDGSSRGTLSTINFWKQKAKIIFKDPTYNCKVFKV